MKEVLINFKSEEKEGIVAVGTYLIDAAKRLGVDTDCVCNDPEAGEDDFKNCIMTVSGGADLLSAPTTRETELLSEAARKKGQRLACEAKFEKAGEVEIMTEKKKAAEEKPQAEAKAEEFKKEFEEMPLEKKIASLVELEAMALSETFSFVVNSPYAAVGKVMDVLAGFGLQMERDDKESKRPVEHVKAEREKEDKTNTEEETVVEAVEDTGEDSEDKKSAGQKKAATNKKKTASKSAGSGKKATGKAADKAEENKDKVENNDK